MFLHGANKRLCLLFGLAAWVIDVAVVLPCKREIKLLELLAVAVAYVVRI